MSAANILRRAQLDAQRHALLGIALLALPWMLALTVLIWRFGGHVWSWLPLVALAAAAGAYAGTRLRRMDTRWLVRTLDARRPDMEDSSALLFASPVAHAGLASLQRERLQARISHGPAPDLRQAWNTKLLWISGIVAACALLAAVLWPRAAAIIEQASVRRADSNIASAGPARLTSQQLEIRPPAYTGLATRRGDSLSAKVPVGSTLAWTLRFEPDAPEAALVFHDGTRLPLQRQPDGRWTASRRIARPTLYRIEPAQPDAEGRPQQHRIDTISDKPPQIRLLQPKVTLSTVTPGQRGWRVAFEASDDYGLASSARLRIVRTEGNGENITANERVLSLAGSGTATRRTYAHGFDLAALGLVPGDDLIVQLIVTDRRAPSPQRITGPSVILRWPPETIEQSGGLDGLMKKVMPAYFRSQRQIIIDAEALQKEEPRLAADTFLERSDTIGVDQRLLRLRYGQFLGEETEGAQLPTSDLPTNDARVADEPASTDDANETHTPDDGHDHGDEEPPQRAARFGEQQQVLERFGHTHDIPEAATLLDPDTRELLRAALNEMWGSEQELRTGHPDRALPYAYRALDLIKKVQQAERIYLPKLGTELPPIDASRRLTGKREGLSGRSDPMRTAPAADTTLADAWRALAPVPAAKTRSGEAEELDLQALSRWLSTHDLRSGDALAIAAALDTVRREPNCASCRQRLRDLLWPLLARPPAAPAPRRNGGRSGDAYLDALREAPR